MTTYLESLTTEELCTMLEDDELITLNMIKEAVMRLRMFEAYLENQL